MSFSRHSGDIWLVTSIVSSAKAHEFEAGRVLCPDLPEHVFSFKQVDSLGVCIRRILAMLAD